MLQILILCLVLAIVLFSAQYGWTKTMKKSLDIEVCRVSVVKHSEKIAIPVVPDIDIGKQIRLDCPRHFIDFFDNHVQLLIQKDFKLEEHEYKVDTEDGVSRFYDELTEDLVNQVVAEEARWCWYKLGKGNIEIRHIKNCIFCTQFKFDEDITKDKFTGIYNYLEEEDISLKKAMKETETEKKYIQYLSRTLKNGKNTLQMDKNLVLEKGKTYIVFFEIDGKNYYIHIGEISDTKDCEWYN